MRIKRLLSLVISTVMILSTFSGLVMTSASAEVGDAANNIWTASAEDNGKEADSVLYDGDKGTLTTKFELTFTTEDDKGPVNETVGSRTFNAFVSHPSMNGGYNSNGTYRDGYMTMFSFVPKEDGVLTVYFRNVGSNKYVSIIKEGATNYKSVSTDGGNTGSLVWAQGTGGSASYSAQLEADRTYLMFVDGSKGQFMAVDYEAGATHEQATPTPVPTVDPNSKSWSASELDFGRKAGDLLMGGLTLVSDNSSTNKAYVSSTENGKLDTDQETGEKVASGSALKFDAYADGILSVTMIDLGEATVNEETGEVTTTKSITPVIYGVSEKANVFEYTTSGNKEKVVCTADVKEGNTYYITATGTKGRFSAAQFIPAGEIPDETDKPIITSSEISYKDGAVTVNLDDTSVTSGVLIIASYNGGVLSNVKTEALTFENGTATKEITVENGAKLMVWNSLEGMKPLCPSVVVSNSSVTPTPTKDPNGLPNDIIWRADDIAFADTLKENGDTVKGLTVPSGLGDKGKKVTYTHVDGTEYTFTSQWSNFGSNTEFSFTPEQACIVYVIFNGNGSLDGKSIEITQGETILGSHAVEIGNNAAAEVAVADVDDPTAGDVIIKGTGGNKNVSAIFVEYYDPTVVVNQTLSGKITYTGTLGLADKTLVFKNTRTNAEFEMPYAGENYSIDLPQKSTYTIYVKDNAENICATLDTREVYLGKEAKTHNISIADIVDDAVTGEVVTHGLDLSNVTLTFTAKDDPTITANAVFSDIGEDKKIETATNKMTVTLTPNHEYTVAASGIDGYTLSPLSSSYLMKAGDTAPFKNILFTKDVAPIAYKSTVTVGADKDYKTIQEALNAVKTMTDRPVGSAGKVEIVIDSGTYIEQLQVKSPYVTLKAADPENRPTVTFYYGIGYLYYSADKGFYSEDKYVQQTELGKVDSWGTTVNVDAPNFLAENIIFENSFNCRVTPEELKDGVTAAGPGKYSDVSNKPDRTVANYDAMTKTAVERAAAICLRGANFEIYNCDFISSQDTFYTGVNGYVKNSYIEGGTDYIYGGNSVVFEDCTLAWHGYSDKATGGYITACKTSASSQNGLNVNSNGYLLKDCTVTNSKYYPTNKFDAGSWGRNWGGKNCRTIFLNTTMDGTDVPGAWVNMSGDGIASSVLHVHGVTDKNGNAVTNVSAYNPNGQMAAEDIAAIDPVSYFNDWTPKYYTGTVPEKTTYTTTWYFGKANGAPEYNAGEGGSPITITGDTDSPTTAALTVNPAAKGKFTNSGRNDEWAQVNEETIFTLPVVNGSKILINTYGSEVLTAPNGAPITKNEPYTYMGEGGNVDFVVTTGGYIASIKVVSPINPEEYVPVVSAVNIAAAVNGTVTTSATEGTAEYGSTVTITATPNTGYKVGEITVTKASGGAVAVNDGKFTMPAEAVTVTVTFAEKQTEQPSKIDYEMPFTANSGVIDGVTISSQQDYKLFDDFVTLKNMKYDNNHGAQGSGPIEVQVPGPVEITVGACAYNDCKVVVTDAAGNKVAEQDNFIGDAQNDASGNKGAYSCYGYNNGSTTLNYNGTATKLTISFEKATNGAAGNARFWLPYLRVKSVDAVTPTTAPTTDPTTAPTTNPTTAPTTAPTEPPSTDVTVSGTVTITGMYNNKDNKKDLYKMKAEELVIKFTPSEGEAVTASVAGVQDGEGENALSYTANVEPNKAYTVTVSDNDSNAYIVTAGNSVTPAADTANNITAVKTYTYSVPVEFDANSYAYLSDSATYTITFNTRSSYSPESLTFTKADVDAETRLITVTGHGFRPVDTDGTGNNYFIAYFDATSVHANASKTDGYEQALSTDTASNPTVGFGKISVTLPPAPTGVTISGTVAALETLQAVVEPAGAGVSYQWYTAQTADAEESAWTAVEDATSASLQLTNDMAGKFIAVKVTGTAVEGTASAITESAVTGSSITSYTYTFAVDQTAAAAPSYNTNTNLLKNSEEGVNNVDKAISMILVAKDGAASCAATGVKITDTTYSKYRIATRGTSVFQNLAETVDTGADNFTWETYSNAAGNPLIVVTPKVKGTFSITIGQRASANSTFYIWDNESASMTKESGQGVIKTLTLTLEKGHTYVMGHTGTGDGAVYEASFTTLENLPE